MESYSFNSSIFIFKVYSFIIKNNNKLFIFRSIFILNLVIKRKFI